MSRNKIKEPFGNQLNSSSWICSCNKFQFNFWLWSTFKLTVNFWFVFVPREKQRKRKNAGVRNKNWTIFNWWKHWCRICCTKKKLLFFFLLFSVNIVLFFFSFFCGAFCINLPLSCAHLRQLEYAEYVVYWNSNDILK